jgi:hypothetical protein
LNNKKALIGIGGVAVSGKDTLCQIVIDIALAMGISAERMALADELKAQIRPKLIEEYGIDVMNCTPHEKEIIRPELVYYGKKKRLESQGTYWTKIIEQKAEETSSELIIVPDVRYSFYPKDEVQWVKTRMGGILVHVSRYCFHEGNVEFVKPPNEDERENDPKVQDAAEFLIRWPTSEFDILKNNYQSLIKNMIVRAVCK